MRLPSLPLLAVAGLVAGCTGLDLFDGGTAEPELTANVEAIRQAEIALQVVDDFLPCSSEEAAKTSASTRSRAWEDPGCFARIGWAPESAVRGGYYVTVAEGGGDFTVVGLADTDGDGTFMRVEATKDRAARVVSEAEVR